MELVEVDPPANVAARSRLFRIGIPYRRVLRLSVEWVALQFAGTQLVWVFYERRVNANTSVELSSGRRSLSNNVYRTRPASFDLVAIFLQAIVQRVLVNRASLMRACVEEDVPICVVLVEAASRPFRLAGLLIRYGAGPRPKRWERYVIAQGRDAIRARVPFSQGVVNGSGVELSCERLVVEGGLVDFFARHLLFRKRRFYLAPHVAPQARNFVRTVSRVVVHREAPRVEAWDFFCRFHASLFVEDRDANFLVGACTRVANYGYRRQDHVVYCRQ